ncbi:MAG TPA: vWA domain-containing protein [Blastocatellia bacterium]|nr:vWA domain-containing protein [Blastocatellia bacterium]
MTEAIEPRRNRGTRKRAIAASALLCVFVALWLFYFHATGAAQSGRNPASGRRVTVVNVFAHRVEDPNKPRSLLSGDALKKEDDEKIIPKQAIEFYDGGVRQEIQAFSPDPTPARIVVVMDNSLTLQSDKKKLASVPAAFAPEIYEGDKVMVIGYDTKPEIITEFTDNPKQLQSTLSLIHKTDTPRLFDSLNTVMEDVLRPEVGFSKRVIVIVGDGLDRDSKIKFDELLSKIQEENVTVYAIQVRDRTRGALRKDAPKPAEALKQLTEGTGGKIYSIDDDVKESVKNICDELRNNRYQLTYYPEGISPINKRLLLISSSDSTVQLRYKGWHPPHKMN